MPSPQPQSPQAKYIIVKGPPEKFTPEWALYRFLDGFTAEDMTLAVKKNYPWDLSGYLNYIIDHARDELLKWLEEYKPEHFKVLNTPEGKRYLKCQMMEALTPK
jgi:hypothetical protein